jgi:hypothetical protein
MNIVMQCSMTVTTATRETLSTQGRRGPAPQIGRRPEERSAWRGTCGRWRRGSRHLARLTPRRYLRGWSWRYSVLLIIGNGAAKGNGRGTWTCVNDTTGAPSRSWKGMADNTTLITRIRQVPYPKVVKNSHARLILPAVSSPRLSRHPSSGNQGAAFGPPLAFRVIDDSQATASTEALGKGLCVLRLCKAERDKTEIIAAQGVGQRRR